VSNKAKLLASAQKSLQKGQVAKAIKDFQKIVEIDPKDIRTRQKLAELYSRAHQSEEALHEYEAVAKYYSENGFYLKSIAVYKQMQKIDGNQVKIYHRLAELNEKQGLVGNALAEYRSLVSYYEQHQMTAEAINVLQKMKELEPENLNVLVKIAESYARSGMKDKAKDEFQEVIERLEQKSDFTKIIKLCEMFLPFFPEDPDALCRKADALIGTGQAVKGIAVLQELLKNNTEDEAILRLLAKGYRKEKDYGNERLTYQQLLKGRNENLELRQALVQACLDGKEFGRALEELEEWKDAYFEADQVKSLKENYEILQEQLPGNEQVVKTLHAIYEVSGEGKKLFDLMSRVEDSPVAPAGSFQAPLETLDDSLLDEVVGDLETTIPDSPDFADLAVAEAELEADLPSADVEPVTAQNLKDATLEGLTPEEAVDDEDGEVPLEFLQGMAEDDQAEVVEETVASAGDDPAVTLPGADIELELELELDLDLDLEEELIPTEAVEEADAIEDDVPEAVVQPDESEVLAEIIEPEPDSEHEEEELAEIVELVEAVVVPEAISIDIPARLEEATFYLQQGLLTEAEAVCQEILEVDAVCADAQAKLELIAAKRAELAAVPAAPEPEPETGVVLEDDPDFDWDDALKEIQGDTVGTIEPEDAESHYNLGIAYREMGLIDDAIKEFDTAMGHPSRRLDSLSLKALCLSDIGDYAGAEEAFRLGLAYPGLGQEERLNLTFEIGQLKEKTGDLEQALKCFLKVADSDHFYREVGVRIQHLRGELGLPDSGGSGSAAGAGDKKKVSYL
jgi:tetratricopeptide (TPR) repeat protein